MFAPNNGLDGLDAAAAAPNAAAVLESMPNNVVDLLPVPPPPPNEKGVDDGVGVAPSSVTMPVAVGTLTEEKNPPSAEGADADVFAVRHTILLLAECYTDHIASYNRAVCA